MTCKSKESNSKSRQLRGPIKLRKKILADKRVSLYLETYWKGERSYEFLRLYLLPEDKNFSNPININTLSEAEKIRAQRLRTLASQEGVAAMPQFTESFSGYFLKCMHSRYDSKGTYGNWDGAFKHLMIYAQGKELTFGDITFQFLMGFKVYLLQAFHLKSGAHKLSQNTAYSYVNKIKAAITLAYDEGKIINDIGKKIYVKPGEPRREVLSLQEVNRLIETDCESITLKRAFIFCLLTGLRFSDMVSLTWSEVLGNSTDSWYLKFSIKKNGRPEHLPITQQAREILGEPTALSHKVFDGLIYSTWVTTALTRWMANAQIWRKITFHCARHTHATLLLDQGVDIFVISKLLGHKHVHTTQIYTRVSVSTRKKALESIPLLNIKNLIPMQQENYRKEVLSHDVDLDSGPGYRWMSSQQK